MQYIYLFIYFLGNFREQSKGNDLAERNHHYT